MTNFLLSVIVIVLVLMEYAAESRHAQTLQAIDGLLTVIDAQAEMTGDLIRELINARQE